MDLGEQNSIPAIPNKQYLSVMENQNHSASCVTDSFLPLA